MKKISLIALALALGLVVGYPAYAESNFITVDATFVTSTLAYIGQLFDDLQLLIIVIIGLPLAFWAVRRIIGLVRAR
jgi:hypothetical protein